MYATRVRRSGRGDDEGSWRDAALRVEKDVPEAWTLFNLKRIIHTRTTQTDGPRDRFPVVIVITYYTFEKNNNNNNDNNNNTRDRKNR